MHKYDYSTKLVEIILQRKPMHKKFINNTYSFLSTDEKKEAELYISYLIEYKGHELNDLADAYTTIVEDTFREELFFKKNGRYRYSKYSEVANTVYHNKEYMWKYMIGLALSSFWWINHVKIRRFFNKCISGISSKYFIEVGPGHGLYFLDALKQSAFENYHGIDISSTSIKLTKEIVDSGYFGKVPDYSLWQDDFLTYKKQISYDFLVMGEVLEHVEDPKLFLSSAYNILSKDGFMFLTTCYNSPAIDHIYNPGSFHNLKTLLLSSGFNMIDFIIAPRLGYTVEQCEEELLPVNVAFLLKKNEN